MRARGGLYAGAGRSGNEPASSLAAAGPGRHPAAVPAADKPAAEVSVDERLVRALLRDQFPELAALDLVELEAGWDNFIFRLGDELVVRLPRRALAAGLVAHEQQWLPVLAPRLPLAIPAPVGAGRPGRGYPWSWSVCPWFHGAPAHVAPVADPKDAAAQLGGFIAALHVDAPPDAPPNPFRGGPLAPRDDVVRERAASLSDVVDDVAVVDRWAALSATPPWDRPPVWLHGDLHPGNVLVTDGRISAVIDFGDITAGDPATDLAVAWMLLPETARLTLRRAAGDVDDHTWSRAQGWALMFGLMFAASSAGDSAYTAFGVTVVEQVLADTVPGA